MKARITLTAAVFVATLSMIAAPACAKGIFDQLNEASARTLFDDIREISPRTVFDDINTSAPVSAPEKEPVGE